MNVSVEIVFRVVQERFEPENPGVIDKHINPAESINRHADHSFAGFLVTDISRHESDPVFMAQCLDGGSQHLTIARIQHDIGPFFQEPSGGIESDTTRGACD